MKKCICIFLLTVILISTTMANCSAITLPDDFNDASLEELIQLREIIDQRISELTPSGLEQISIGESIDLPFAQIKLNKFVQQNELKFSQKETGSYEISLVKDKNDAQYLAIYGEIKSKGKSPFRISDGIKGQTIIDGYEYEVDIFALNDKIEPFDNTLVFLYALVPNELAQNFNSCIIRFGFDENFDETALFFKNFDEYAYRYEIKLK
ncbi:MAG: hypothetical protein IJD39_05760 [Clostridia bacterium]|nr:hypothetical protein [Clostridia bacterium]